MSGLTGFSFEVQPFVYDGLHGGAEFIYNITVTVDGVAHQVKQIVPDINPGKTEVRHLVESAIKQLEYQIACRDDFDAQTDALR